MWNNKMKMAFHDQLGTLYSGDGISVVGLRFGGFQTSQFIDTTEPLERKRPGVSREVIAEAHYLAMWPYKICEIGFYIGLVCYTSLQVAFAFFFLAFFLEVIRFYLFGANLMISWVCRIWQWVKSTLFVITAIVLWSTSYLLSVYLLVFLFLQCYLNIIVAITITFIKCFIGRFVYRKYGQEGLHWANMEGMALSFVITKWIRKLLPEQKE